MKNKNLTSEMKHAIAEGAEMVEKYDDFIVVKQPIKVWVLVLWILLCWPVAIIYALMKRKKKIFF